MTAVVRAECARGLPDLIRRLGGDADRLLSEAGVSPEVLAQRHAYVPQRALIHAVERASHELDCPDLGLRLAAGQDVSVLGPLAVAMSHAATIGEALQCAAKYLYTQAPAVELAIRPVPDSPCVMLAHDFRLERLPPHRQSTEAHVGLLHRVVTMLSEGRSRPCAVTFRHRIASPAAAQSHYQFFGAPVRFEASENALIVAAADLEIPILGGNPQVQEIAAGFLEATFPAPAPGLAVQVRALAERLLNAGCCTPAEAAAALGLQERTLQRRLQEAGTSFEAIRDDARRHLAERYLTQHAIPLSQISGMLGYAEPTTFTRSCRRWFGCSPREMRARFANAAYAQPSRKSA